MFSKNLTQAQEEWREGNAIAQNIARLTNKIEYMVKGVRKIRGKGARYLGNHGYDPP